MAEVDVYVKIFLSTLSVLIVAFNAFVWCLVCFKKTLRTYTNWLIVSLTLSYILVGRVLLPMFLTKHSSMVTDYVVSVILLSSVSNLCMVSYVRYKAVIKPLEYRCWIPKMFTKAVILSWLIPVIFSLVPLFWNTDTKLKIHKAYIICLQLFGFVVPCFFIELPTFEFSRKFDEVPER